MTETEILNVWMRKQKTKLRIEMYAMLDTTKLIILFYYSFIKIKKCERFYVLIQVLHLQRIHAEVSHYISIQTASSVIG